MLKTVIMKPLKTLTTLPQEAIRRQWPNEAHDFTPWLEKNIGLLSDAVGIQLEVCEREAPVGGLSVDIFCRDSISGEGVIVENQIQVSDHGHIGQIVTYLAGLDACTALWVAPCFKPEHLSAVRWLNTMLYPNYKFYAISYGLYKIGDSEPAVQFQVIVSPNADARKVVEHGELDLAKADFWAGFVYYLDGFGERPFRVNKPSPRGYINIPIGSRVFHIAARINAQSKRASVELWAEGERAKEAYDKLYALGYEESKMAVSTDIQWRRLDNKKASIISVSRNADFLDTEHRNELYSWLTTEVCLFRRVFLPMINSLSL